MKSAPVVNSYDEWGVLEEVIVGSVRGAAEMAFEPAFYAYYPKGDPKRKFLGGGHSEEEIERAEVQLDGLANLLELEGIIVVRPDPVDYNQPFQTPDFEAHCGNCSACPRDVLLVVGDEIIEAPMAQRGRYFEYRAYRSLVKGYFRQGARWSVAPKPFMSDDLYVADYSNENTFFDADTHPNLTDFEPCFDAASFVRMGKDIFYAPDLVTNDFGAQWLQRHLGPNYRFHRLKFADKHPPQHLDTTLVPLRPGLLMVNPERPCSNGMLKVFQDNDWEIVEAPPSVRGKGFHCPEISNWISMNVLSLSENKIVVEEAETPMIKFLEKLNFDVLTCPFADVYKFGGSFHCCTTDIRRKSTFTSYFPNLDQKLESPYASRSDLALEV